MVHIDIYRRALEMKRLGVSAKNIALELGVNYYTISNWFIGKGTSKYEKKITGQYVGLKIDEGVDISPIGYLKMLSSINDDITLFRLYSYIFGLYLGDGNIMNFKRTKCLSVTLDSKYNNLNEDVIDSFRLLFSDVSVVIRKYNAVDVKYHDCNLGLLFPQDSPGLKCDREIGIEKWQAEILDPIELLRGLIMSDGSYYMRKSNSQHEYNFCNCSLDIINITCKCLDILEIQYGLRFLPTKIKNNHDSYKITVSAKAAVNKLHEYIGDKEDIRDRSYVNFDGFYGDFNEVKSFRCNRNKLRLVNEI